MQMPTRYQMTAAHYLAQVEPAVRHQFEGIESYLDQFRRIRRVSQAKKEDRKASRI
jgi:hypothetical protein